MIDWSQAPDDAEAAHEESHEQMACWYRKDGLCGNVKIMLCENYGTWIDMGGRRDFPYGAVIRQKINGAEQ